MNIPTFEIDTFIRSVGVNRGSPHAIFLGAGASITSGIPSAEKCIWLWKKSIFCTNNPGLEEQVSELSLPAVQDRIDRWLKVNGFSPDKSQDEYSYFIEKCLPIADDRRRFFEHWIRKARPHVGYRLLCLLAEARLFRSIWTTNFDGLVARASADFDLTPVEVGSDCKERVFRQPEQNELVCVSLHGDYRYDPLKNTSEELQSQEAELRNALISTLRTHSLIVNGYSGRLPACHEMKPVALKHDLFDTYYFRKKVVPHRSHCEVPGLSGDEAICTHHRHCEERARNEPVTKQSAFRLPRSLQSLAMTMFMSTFNH
ncbi:MAG: hypothetical protein HGB26_06280 [Desulfobulbaceae bacterium]|nr:hypothetical protein [Desulfobulbaceae bacterium]